MDIMSSDKDEPNLSDGRRSFLNKLGALIAGAAVAPSLIASSGFLDKPKHAQVPSIGAQLDSLRDSFLPLPEGFEVMSLPTELITWKGEERVIVAKTQKLKTEMKIDPLNFGDRSPSLIDYNKLTQELRELGYTHLYCLMRTQVIYTPRTFEPKVGLMIRGCCLA